MTFPTTKTLADAETFMSYNMIKEEIDALYETGKELINRDAPQFELDAVNAKIRKLDSTIFLTDTERHVGSCAYRIHTLTGCAQVEAESLARALVWIQEIVPASTANTINEVCAAVPYQLTHFADDYITVDEMRAKLVKDVKTTQARVDELIVEAASLKEKMSDKSTTISQHHKLARRQSKNEDELRSANFSLKEAKHDLEDFSAQLDGLDGDLGFYAGAFLSSHRDRSHRQIEIVEDDQEAFGTSRTAMVIYGLTMAHLRATYPNITYNAA